MDRRMDSRIDRHGPGLVAALLAVALAASPVAASENSDEVRLGISAGHALSDRLSLALDAQARLTEGGSRLGVIRLGGELSFESASGLTFAGGYDITRSRPSGRPGDATHRLYEQIGVPLGSLGRLRFDGRTRLEQRFRAEGNGGASHRLRQRLRLLAPLGGVRASVSGEALLLLHDGGGGGSGLEQLRGTAGLQLPIGRKMAFEAAYMKRIVLAGRDRFDDVFDFKLTTEF